MQNGHSFTNCGQEQGLKWRAERNFWIMGFNFLCWLMVDRLAERIKVEEMYSTFLEKNGQTDRYAAHYAEMQRSDSASDPKRD